MTKAEWEKVEDALYFIDEGALLKIDGYEVTLVLRQESTYKNHIRVYINGVIKSEWIASDCEERRRFLCKKSKAMYTQKNLCGNKNLTEKDKKQLKDFIEKNQSKIEYYNLYWDNFKALKSHLIKNNDNIEFVRTLNGLDEIFLKFVG